MSLKSVIILCLFVLSINSLSEGEIKNNSPPHCTHVIKEDINYAPNFKFVYPAAYIAPGQQEAYQQMFCLNPPAVNKAVTTVCDWAAPPQVQFTLGDVYLRVVRVDPSRRFLGNAVITTYQLCAHDIPPQLAYNATEKAVVQQLH